LARRTIRVALAVLPLLRTIAHPLIERFQAAHQIPRLVDGAAEGILLFRLAERLGGLADLVLQPFEVGLDVGFHGARVVAGISLQRVLRVSNLLTHAFVGDAAGGLVQLARCVFLAAARFVRQLLELILETCDLLVHRVLALRERLRLGLATGAQRLLESLHF